MKKNKKFDGKRRCRRCDRETYIPFSAGCLSGIKVCKGCEKRVEDCTCRPLKVRKIYIKEIPVVYSACWGKKRKVKKEFIISNLKLPRFCK